jgi:hypothetical protein
MRETLKALVPFFAPIVLLIGVLFALLGEHDKGAYYVALALWFRATPTPERGR